MTQKVVMGKVLLYLLLGCLLILPFVHGTSVGVSPASQKILFEASQTSKVQVNILNREGYREFVRLSLGGEYAQYARLEQSEIELPPQSSTPVFVYVDHPLGIVPQDYLLNLGIEVIASPEYYKEQGFMGAVAGFVHTIVIKVPRQGKYAELTMQPVKDANIGSTIYFTLEAVSYGSEDLKDISALITIKDATGTSYGTLDTGKKDLAEGSSVKLFAYWESKGAPAGSYSANAVMDYGGASPAQAARTFHLGELLLRLLGAEITAKGPIILVTTMVQSEWNDPIEGVVAEVSLIGAEKTIVATAKSTSETIAPRSGAVLSTYLDVPNLAKGQYTAHIVVHYQGRESELIVPYYHDPEELLQTPISEGTSVFFTTGQLLILVVVVLGVNGLLFYLLGRKKKGEVEKP